MAPVATMCMCMYLFEVERVVQVRHAQLDESFEARKHAIEAAAPGGAGGSPSAERVHTVFHGTPRRLLAAIDLMTRRSKDLEEAHGALGEQRAAAAAANAKRMREEAAEAKEDEARKELLTRD